MIGKKRNIPPVPQLPQHLCREAKPTKGLRVEIPTDLQTLPGDQKKICPIKANILLTTYLVFSSLPSIASLNSLRLLPILQ